MLFFYNEINNENNNSNIQVSEEMLANKILQSAMVDYTDVPIDIERILRNYGFSIGTTPSFGKDKIVAGIAYTEKPLKHIDAQRFFIFRKDMSLRDRRYLMALAIVHYVMESKDSYYIKSIYKEVFTESEELNKLYARVARAILMPQKSLSTLLMSPMIHKLNMREQIENVSKAFLVGDDIAELRMRETGLI